MANDAGLGINVITTFVKGDQIILNRLRCDAVSEMLGVWLEPNGNHTQIVAELKEFSIEWGENLDLVVLLIMRHGKLYIQIYLLI